MPPKDVQWAELLEDLQANKRKKLRYEKHEEFGSACSASIHDKATNHEVHIMVKSTGSEPIPTGHRFEFKRKDFSLNIEAGVSEPAQKKTKNTF